MMTEWMKRFTEEVDAQPAEWVRMGADTWVSEDTEPGGVSWSVVLPEGSVFLGCRIGRYRHRVEVQSVDELPRLANAMLKAAQTADRLHSRSRPFFILRTPARVTMTDAVGVE